MDCSSTTTKSPRKRKKYQFTYFHYDPPPYWYVWPEIPKCTKRECLLASKKKIIPKVGSNFKTGTDSREMLSSTSKSISKVAGAIHLFCRYITAKKCNLLGEDLNGQISNRNGREGIDEKYLDMNSSNLLVARVVHRPVQKLKGRGKKVEDWLKEP